MKKNSTKRNNRTIVLGAIISLVLLLAIIVSIFYKTEQENNIAQSAPVDGQGQITSDEEQRVEKPKEQPKEQPTSEVIEAETNPTVEEPKKDEPLNAVAKEEPVFTGGYMEGQQLPTEPTYVDGILIANKKSPLPATYNEGENPKAKAAFNELAAAAKLEGIELVAFSGFRSYEYQTTLYNNYVARDGQKEADRYSARPGYSEHQTGLAFDIGEKGREDLWLTSAFGETKAGKWLANNAHNYGFILRYPKGKETITGFMYESWHFRHLGVETATKVYKSGLTLEEYLGID